MTRPVLIILHQEHSTPGRVGRLLQQRGISLDIRRPRFGDALPQTMDDHAGAIIFGGPMSANDPDDWMKIETDWIGVPLRDKSPFLGICLGAQMLTRHLGGTVSFHPAGKIEAGYYPIIITPEGRALEKEMGAPWPDTVYQWHREGTASPACCTNATRSCGSPWRATRKRIAHSARNSSRSMRPTCRSTCASGGRPRSSTPPIAA